MSNGKKMAAQIGEKRNKRSLDANAYAWALMNELGNVMRTSKEEVYEMMLRRYGQRQRVKVLTEGLPILLSAIEHYDIKSEEGNCTYVAIYKGSSKFDTREMSIFIDGIVDECKAVGIDTRTPAELAILKNEWGQKNE